MKRLRFSRHALGSMTAFFALLLVGLLSFAALVTDAGMLYVERRHLQNTVDAAALAGARVFLVDFNTWSQGDVVAAVEQWAQYNGVPASQLTDITVGTKSLPVGTLPTVTVSAERPVNLMFAFAFGFKQMTVGAHAQAGISPLRPLKIWPWAISESTYNQLLQDQATNGFTYLKLSSQGNATGNFLPLDLGGSGATGYENNIINGFYGPLPAQVPPNIWTVPTQPGNMAGPTEDGVEYLQDQPSCTIPGHDIRCPLIGLVPVITDESWLAASGAASSVDVIQFPVFRVDGLMNDPTAPGGGKGHQVVQGQFLDQGTAVGPTDPYSTIHLYGVRLWD